MIKLLSRYGRRLAPMLAAAVALLAVQAWGDLSLPQYMSNIVNVGIQQGGIDSVVPVKARQTTMNGFLSAMAEEERGQAMAAYTVDWNGFWTLNPMRKAERAALEPLFAKYVIQMAAERGVPMEGMSDAAVLQAAAPFLRAEYTACGLNPDKMQTSYIFKTGLFMVGLSFLIMAAVMLASFLSARVAATLARLARGDVFRKAVRFSNAEFDGFAASTLITRSTNDVQQIQGSLPMMIRTLIYAPIMGLGGVIKVFRAEASMTWIIALAVGVLLVVIAVSMFFAMPKFNRIQKVVDKVNLIMREALSGMLVIRAFNTERHEEGRFDEANRELTQINVFVGRLMSSLMPLMMIVMNGTQLLIIWVGASKIANAEILVGDMFAFIQYAMQVIMSFLFISVMAFMLPRTQVAAGRINEVLDTESTLTDPESPVSLGKVKGEVVFESVSFRYPDAEDDVLHDISFTAQAGKTTAFIGSTGSGKSTLVNLIPRFYDISGGSIKVDGVDVRRAAQDELRRNIGYIPQKGILFTGTIESNIKFGGGVTNETMRRAAKTAQAEEFINEKEKSYYEPVSQGGTNVSGGQRQRLSIARALAKEPPIYIFDDSFSALDFKTDAALRAALAKDIRGATVLIVAQRIGTIKNADQIVVLDEGAVVGIGTHKELMANCEVYQQIALSQLSQEELDKDMAKGGAAV